jgi:L-phenylalanine/L-methionine N-acetyltransferase
VAIAVRRVLADDAGAVQQALDSVARERRFILRVEAPPVEDVRSLIFDALRCDLPYYVASEAKEIVGFCAITRRMEAGCGHVGQLGMAVVADYRRQGLGRQLLSLALEHAARVSVTRIELEVYSSNQAAINLYESLRFQKEGVRQRARYLDGVWDDMTLMALLATDIRPEAQ